MTHYEQKEYEYIPNKNLSDYPVSGGTHYCGGGCDCGAYTDNKDYYVDNGPNYIGGGGGSGYIYPQITTYPISTTYYPYWPNYCWPYPYWPYYPHPCCQPTIALTVAPQLTYKTMELPRKDIPSAVLIDGRIVTLGALGTDVECAHIEGFLVFAPGVTEGKTILVLEYPEGNYTYNIQSPATKKVLDVKLVSATKK